MPVLNLAAVADQVNITPWIMAIEDQRGVETINSVSTPSARFSVPPTNGDGVNYGVRPSVVWLRLTVSNSSADADRRFMEIAYAHHEHLDLYVPAGTGQWQVLHAGVSMPFSQRSTPNRFPVFEFEVPPHSQINLYLRAQSVNPLDFPITLWTPSAFRQHVLTSYMLQAAYCGMLGLMVVFNLLLFCLIRDRIYALYALFVTSVILSVGCYQGLGYQYLWGDSVFWAVRATMIMFSITLILMMQLMRQLLITPQTVPRLDIVTRWAMVIHGLMIVAYLADFSALLLPGVLLDIAGMLQILVTAIACARPGNRSAHFFLLAFFALILTAIATGLRGMAILPSNFFTINGMQIGSAIQSIVLAFTLADRFNVSKLERERAQAETLAAQQLMLDSLHRSERELESRVVERTQELSAANQRLREHEEALEKAVRETARVSDLKSQFLANMSHEIRTPMNAIIGLSGLLLETRLDSRQHDWLRKISTAAGNLLSIINDILDFNKIEADQLKLEQIPFSLDELLRNIAAITGLRASEKHIEYLFLIDPEVPRHLIGDPVRLGQVLTNLANNAIKFTANGHVHLCITRGDDSPDTVTLKISVRDTGIGMTEEHLGRLFQAFTQADGSTTRQFGGTGLGLVICKRLVNMMGGEIAVKSQFGEGSTMSFSISLPVCDDSHRQAPTDKHVVNIALSSSAESELLASVLRGLHLGVHRVKTEGESDQPPCDLLITDQSSTYANYKGLAIWVGEDCSTSEATVIDRPLNQLALLDALSVIIPDDVAAGSLLREQIHPVNGVRLLLVEDNEINQEIACEFLKSAGFEVKACQNGQAALDILNEGSVRFDLILMDVQMPVMDGYEASRRIRENPKHNDTPIIALTAHAMVQERDRCIANGMQDVVVKPIDRKVMLDCISRWLSLRSVGDNPTESNTNDFALLKGFDVEVAIARMGGKVSLYKRLLQKFPSSVGHSQDSMLLAIANGDLRQATRVAHTVRGVAANMGAFALANSAGELESALDQMPEGQELDQNLLAHYGQILTETLDAVETYLANVT